MQKFVGSVRRETFEGAVRRQRLQAEESLAMVHRDNDLMLKLDEADAIKPMSRPLTERR